MGIPHCAHCTTATSQGTLTQVLADTIQCLQCGNFTDMHGNALPVRPQFKALNHQEKRELGLVDGGISG